MAELPEDDFRWTDPWLLLAVAFASREGPASLAGVLAMGDGINHAIFTHAELDRGLVRLIAAGLVEREAGGFRLSGQGAQFVAQASAGDGQRIDVQLEAVRRLLAAPAWSADANAEVESTVETAWSVVDPAEYRAATRQYR
jgi:hypothetical protein